MARRRVILLPSPRMTTSEAWSALKRKRRTLWHHGARNHLIAEVAAACLVQDKPALKAMGVPVKNKKRGVWTHRVVVLVENAEHARTLGDLLPGWDVLTTVPTREAVDEDEEGVGMPLTSASIVTWMHAERHDIDADYLIRATGWRGKIDLRGEDNWLKRPSRGLTLVDFDDQWDLQAGMDTEARVQEYREQELDVMYANKNITMT